MQAWGPVWDAPPAGGPVETGGPVTDELQARATQLERELAEVAVPTRLVWGADDTAADDRIVCFHHILALG